MLRSEGSMTCLVSEGFLFPPLSNHAMVFRKVVVDCDKEVGHRYFELRAVGSLSVQLDEYSRKSTNGTPACVPLRK